MTAFFAIPEGRRAKRKNGQNVFIRICIRSAKAGFVGKLVGLLKRGRLVRARGLEIRSPFECVCVCETKRAGMVLAGVFFFFFGRRVHVSVGCA
jgi:hypothetical protein